MRLGAHLSTAGGLHTAFARGAELGCTAIQIFISSPRQWRGRELSDEDAERFAVAWEGSESETCLAHDIYLTRLGSRDRTILRKSRAALVQELCTCLRLGLDGLVVHPVGDDDPRQDRVLDRVAASLDAVLEEVPDPGARILLETTAGQGSTVGYRFEQLAGILQRVRQTDRLGICLDTCHVFAAGYDLSTKEGYRSTMKAFDQILGLDLLEAIHLNDSQKPCGSRVDRHAHIGEGEIGETAFGLIMRDRRLARIPKVIETPKEGDMDRVNLSRLRRLAGAA
ncbi:MAG: deoxyribonuclease IV [Gemmatimonadota bacterium]